MYFAIYTNVIMHASKYSCKFINSAELEDSHDKNINNRELGCGRDTYALTLHAPPTPHLENHLCGQIEARGIKTTIDIHFCL